MTEGIEIVPMKVPCRNEYGSGSAYCRAMIIYWQIKEQSALSQESEKATMLSQAEERRANRLLKTLAKYPNLKGRIGVQ